MQLNPLPVIARAMSRFPDLSFQWTGEDADDTVGEIDDELQEVFDAIDSVAVVGYLLCTAEWLLCMLQGKLDEAIVKDCADFIDAHWVWTAELPRRIPPAPYVAKLGPGARSVYSDAIEVGLESITNGIASVRHHETGVDAAFMAQLCEYILPDETGFPAWHRAVCEKLRHDFAADATSYDKTCIVRSYFDTDSTLPTPDRPGSATSAAALGAGPASNPYLPLASTP